MTKLARSIDNPLPATPLKYYGSIDSVIAAIRTIILGVWTEQNGKYVFKAFGIPELLAENRHRTSAGSTSGKEFLKTLVVAIIKSERASCLKR
jgi:hypothetical protein